MRIKIAIATCISFEEKTLPIIIPSLLDAGIDAEDINVFCAGHTSYEVSKQEYHYHKIDNNSFEYSPLITIIEQELESDYWFLIHDTCRVGPKFKELLYKIPEHKPEKIALSVRPSMSVGCYRYDYLQSPVVKEKLLAIKNTDYSVESINKWKEWGVDAEDYILWQTKPKPYMYAPELGDGYSNRVRRISEDRFYSTSVTRLLEYYPSLDLYKYKSNWVRKKLGEYITSL